MDKYQLLDKIFNALGAIADARGVDRCVVIAQEAYDLRDLRQMLVEEDKAREGQTNG